MDQRDSFEAPPDDNESCSVPSQRQLITSGPIVKAIFSLAVPVVLGMLMEVLLTVTGFFWVGKLGPAAQDAVTSSMIVIWTIYSTGSLIGIGVTALVSRHIGAAEPEKAAFYIRQALVRDLVNKFRGVKPLPIFFRSRNAS